MNHEGLEVKGEDHEKLAAALGTIAEVLVGRELQSMRTSAEGLNSKLSSCVDAVKEETTRAMDELREQMSSRIDEMLGKLAHAEEQRGKIVADLERRIDEVKKQIQAVQEEMAKRDLESVSEKVTALQEKLQRQQANTERISTTLGSLANVLSGAPQQHAPVVQPPAPEPVPVETAAEVPEPEPQPEPPRPSVAAEAVSDATESGEIDNVLDRAFGGD